MALNLQPNQEGLESAGAEYKESIQFTYQKPAYLASD